jgi:hypothetical protein
VVLRTVAVIACAACGRVNFDPSPGPPDAALIPDGFTRMAVELGETPTATFKNVTADTCIEVTSQTRTNGDDTILEVDGQSSATTILIVFDLEALPANAIVETAHLEYSTTGNVSGSDNGVFLMLEDWDETEASWLERRIGESWATTGAEAPGSRGATAFATFVSDVADTRFTVELEAPGRAAIEGWLANPTSNFGFALATAASTGWALRSSEHPETATRPSLQLVLLVPD